MFCRENKFVTQDPNAGQLDDRFIGENFVLAGSTTAAGTSGFVAIFLDVHVNLTVGTNTWFNFDRPGFQSVGGEKLRQGMDLVATDYFFCRADRRGVPTRACTDAGYVGAVPSRFVIVAMETPEKMAAR